MNIIRIIYIIHNNKNSLTNCLNSVYLAKIIIFTLIKCNPRLKYNLKTLLYRYEINYEINLIEAKPKKKNKNNVILLVSNS